MKIYVITKGCYSDYHICGVATEKEKAEYIAKECTDCYENTVIEEYDTETWDEYRKGARYFQVVIRSDGSGFVEVEDIEDIHWYGVNKVEEHHGVFEVHVMAKNKRHAKKIGLDLIYANKYYREMYGNGERT